MAQALKLRRLNIVRAHIDDSKKSPNDQNLEQMITTLKRRYESGEEIETKLTEEKENISGKEKSKKAHQDSMSRLNLKIKQLESDNEILSKENTQLQQELKANKENFEINYKKLNDQILLLNSSMNQINQDKEKEISILKDELQKFSKKNEIKNKKDYKTPRNSNLSNAFGLILGIPNNK